MEKQKENVIDSLNDFINRAVKSRKYRSSTASALRVALRFFGEELNEEEQASLEVLENNLDQIADSIFQKKGTNYTQGSINTYKARIKKVISAYKEHGKSSNWSNWNPETRVRLKKDSPERKTAVADTGSKTIPFSENYHRIELALRPGEAKFIVSIPKDMNSSEYNTLASILKTLVSDQADRNPVKPDNV